MTLFKILGPIKNFKKYRDETQTHGSSSCVTPISLQRKNTQEPFYSYEQKQG